MTSEEKLLEELRPASFAIAYRMLGSVSEAEDVVQEALLRIHRALIEGQRIESLRAFATTVTTRLAIDELRSARARRERYTGEWLPEPLVTEGEDDPARHAEMADALSMAMLVLLETLSPEQRAVLLLRDVFDYPYQEIAGIVGKSEDNVRQLAARARRHVDEGRPRFESSREQREELARRFFAAAQNGALGELETLLAHDVVLTGDGGGKVPALARSLHGRSRVARTLFNWIKAGARIPGAALKPVEINGAPGALIVDGEGQLIAVWALETRRDKSSASTRSSTPTSWRTSARSPRRQACSARCDASDPPSSRSSARRAEPDYGTRPAARSASTAAAACCSGGRRSCRIADGVRRLACVDRFIAATVAPVES